MTQNLSSYWIFYTVANAGNISKAAKELYISQPAISKSIQKLEESLNCKLFSRSSRGVLLTDEGALLYDHVKEAFESIIKKKNYEDAMVSVEINPEKGAIDIYSIRQIVDEVVDDVLEVSREDAEEELKTIPGTFVDGDNRLNTPILVDDFTRADALKFKSILKQKIKEAEKANIYAAYSDKVGEIVTGYVEKVEPRYTLINLGRTSVILSDKHKIGDETFKTGDAVKVYLAEVNSSSQGPQIAVSRSDSGFLKRLFEE